MKVASFFVLSLSLHGAVLVYPMSVPRWVPAELIPVTLVSVQQEPPGGGDGGGRGNLGPRRALKPRHAGPLDTEVKPEAKPKSDPAPPDAEAVEKDDSSAVALISESADFAEHVSGEASAAAVGGSDGGGADIGSGNGGERGDGFGLSETGPGLGRGHGSGGSGGGVVLTQARYRDTPKPHYPDSARREGREGRALLRVLVDEQGRSKKVEIHSGSGSDALDRAALEAIRRWRFHPARKGDQPVESWLRIPIEFRLDDTKR